MGAKLIGAHMPTAGGLHNAIEKGAEIGCSTVQVFTSNPQQWKAKELSSEAIAAFRAASERTGIRALVSHDSYLVNLCSPEPEIRQKSIAALKAEIDRSAQLGIPFVVSHMGAHKGEGEAAGIAKIVEATREILAETPEDVTLLMETTAGQGSALGCRFEQLAAVLDGVKGAGRLAICVDTCHLFVAGYDIRTAETYEATLAEFDRIVGCDLIRAIHANDSKKGLGTKIDRHEHIGQGAIGTEAFRLLVNDPRFVDVPIVIETPEADTQHAENVRVLRELRA
ncbi:MAG: Endonuclease 4 [Fimbriimonadaceae bacterium]|nr:Endonuclease 4 [Fimbriimonadaceae bacterium]